MSYLDIYKATWTDVSLHPPVNLTEQELRIALTNNIVYYSILIPLGLAGNLFTLTAVIMVLKVKSSVPNLLIGVLAATDLFCIFTSHLISVISLIKGEYIGSQGTCHFHAMMAYTYFKLGFLTKCSISFDRYIALRFPLKYSQIITRKRIIIVIVHNVVFSFGSTALTLIIDPEYIQLLPTWHMCVNNFRYATDYKLAILVIEGAIFTVGVVIFLVGNMTIIKVMIKLNKKTKRNSTFYGIQMKPNKSELSLQRFGKDKENGATTAQSKIDETKSTDRYGNPNQSYEEAGSRKEHWQKAIGKVTEQSKTEQKISKRQHKELQFAKLVMVIVTVFVILWMPYMTVIYWEYHNEQAAQYFIEDIVIKLVFANSCINPILYGIFNANFRRAYVYYLKMLAHLITCRLSRRPPAEQLPWTKRRHHTYATNQTTNGRLSTVAVCRAFSDGIKNSSEDPTSQQSSPVVIRNGKSNPSYVE